MSISLNLFAAAISSFLLLCKSVWHANVPNSGAHIYDISTALKKPQLNSVAMHIATHVPIKITNISYQYSINNNHNTGYFQGNHLLDQVCMPLKCRFFLFM